MAQPISGEVIAQRIKRAALMIGKVAEKELYLAAELIMRNSKRNYVPVDLSALKNSGHVVKPVRKGTQIIVELAYGGPAAPYALAVHEHLSQHSPRSWKNTTVRFHPAGRGPKYLEKPLMEAVSQLPHDLAVTVNIEKIFKQANG